MDNRRPSSYPHRILLAVTGLSPQIVTETLHALTVGMDEPFVPTEIHLITTAEGAERAKLALLSDKPGWFHRLRTDFDLPEIAFDISHIHVLRDADGQALVDIRSPEDNLACADFITETVRRLSARADCALHVSIAGGRKTMGFFLGYALSLYGRPQDRLSHVLVSEPFENSWAFFYPTPYEYIIETATKKLVDARDAKLSLAEIPFVSLRYNLASLLDGSASFEKTVAAARSSLEPARLEIDLGTRAVQAGEHRFQLSRAHLALLLVFARRAMNGEAALAAPSEGTFDSEWAERYLAELRRIADPMADLSLTEKTLAEGMDDRFFAQSLSKLRRALKSALGPAATPYLIDDGGKRPRRYRLALPAHAVQITDSRRHASLQMPR